MTNMTNTTFDTFETNSDITKFAKQLASLLRESMEFQELIRMGKLVNLDPDVSRILQQIRNQESIYTKVEDSPSLEELKVQLEEVPAYQAYLKSENAARDLFRSVNQVINSIVGIDFAENSRPQGCGCGG